MNLNTERLNATLNMTVSSPVSPIIYTFKKIAVTLKS
jgi:hypothetical protein